MDEEQLITIENDVYLQPIYTTSTGNKKVVNVSSAIIINEDNTEMLVGLRPDNKRWEFIGGKIEKGESPIDALYREVKEEIDCDIKNVKFYTIKKLKRKSGEMITVYFFKCNLVNGDVPSKIVHDSLLWIPIKSIHSLKFLDSSIDIVNKLYHEYVKKKSVKNLH
jgi:8-oxo-dGTP diphosphatase